MMNSIPVVIGSGLAGLLTARLIAEKQPVLILTKNSMLDANTRYSQGGIAAVWSKKDSVELHTKDTLIAGKGLCDSDAVELLSSNSRSAIEQLIGFGVQFDKDENNEFMLGLEAAHSVNRILHAGGDSTGFEIQNSLVNSVKQHPNIEIKEYSLATKLFLEKGALAGVRCFSIPDQRIDFIPTNQCVVATGGAGQIYQYTSNPPEATGEGVILAYQAGADLMDLEFYQFHPTGLNLPGAPTFLITEALRGEGAIIKNDAGDPIMEKVHPQKDLAPRDVVARAITSVMKEGFKTFLDTTMIGAKKLENRFPTIFSTCKKYGLDIRKEWIPISPVAHYMIGGIVTDFWGRSTIPGLYACGEAARTGVHGANRLASNSLIEAAVFAIRTGQAIIKDQTKNSEPWANLQKQSEIDLNISLPQKCSIDHENLSAEQFQRLMWKNVGLVRNRECLEEMRNILYGVPLPSNEPMSREQFELQSMKQLGLLMAESALSRTESRGVHFREDYPNTMEDQVSSIRRRRKRDLNG